MAATQLALWMLALPVLAAVLCRHFWKRPPTRRRAFTATLSGVLLFLYPPHMCDAGTPTMQLLIGVICVVFVATCATDVRIASALGIVFALATIGMAVRYDSLVHDERFIGRRHDSLSARRQRRMAEGTAISELTGGQEWSSPPIREGWLSDDPRSAKSLKSAVRSSRETGDPFWHSTFTHLYARRRVPMELWYPGGPVESAAHNLEWRDRP